MFPIKNMFPTKSKDNIYSELYGRGKGYGREAATEIYKYMFEMSQKHPIMYLLWYRWWLPTLLTDWSREYIAEAGEDLQYNYNYPVWWTGFAMYHPLQFVVLYLLFVFVFQPCKKSLSRFIKVVNWCSIWVWKTINGTTDDSEPTQ